MSSELTNPQFVWSMPVSRAEVYWYVSDTGVANAQEISNGIGLSKSTVQAHLSALNKAGAVTGEGRPKQYRVREDISDEYLSELKHLEYLARITPSFRGCGVRSCSTSSTNTFANALVAGVIALCGQRFTVV